MGEHIRDGDYVLADGGRGLGKNDLGCGVAVQAFDQEDDD